MSESQYITIAYVRQTGHILAAITRQSSEDQDIEKDQLVSSSLTVRHFPTVEEITLTDIASAPETSITVGTAGDLEAGDTIMIEGNEFTVVTINTGPPITIPISPEVPTGQTWPIGTTVNMKIKQPLTSLSFDIDANYLNVAVTKDVSPDISSILDNPRKFHVVDPDKEDAAEVISLPEYTHAIEVENFRDDGIDIIPKDSADDFGDSELLIWGLVSDISDPTNEQPIAEKKKPEVSDTRLLKVSFTSQLTVGDYRLIVFVQNRPAYAQTFTI